jgi:hypothetical protein
VRAIDRRVHDSGRRFRVIPVLLPGAQRAERSSLPTFLAATAWVEFHDSLDDPTAFHRWYAAFAALNPEPTQAKPFMKGSVLTAVYAFSMWTMLPFSSDAKLWFNGC